MSVTVLAEIENRLFELRAQLRRVVTELFFFVFRLQQNPPLVPYLASDNNRDFLGLPDGTFFV